MSAQVTITQLPSAGAITGTELVPVVQNGVTVKTTTAALAGSPIQTQTFITKNQEPTLANSRSLSNGTGIGLVDGGAQSTLAITLNAASGSLESASNGMIAKTASNAVVARTMISSTTGLSVTNGDGVAGAPAFALTGVALAVAGATGTGALALTGPTTVATRTILGTTSQIAVTDGNFVNSPVIAIASDPILPGTGGVVVPAGTTGQRGTSTLGNFRYNSTTGLFEGYNGAWTAFASGSGVTSIATGTGLTGGPITSTGTISIDVTGVTAATYGSSSVVPVIAVNAQGQITSATNTTINAVTLTTGTISTTPSNSTDIANKAYVDTVAQGLDTKASVVAATTVNITLSGAQTIDGVAVVATDRVLVKNQTAPADNGIYIASATAWSRAPDMNTWAQVPGAYVFIEGGTTLADTGWVCTSDAGGTIGVTAITWAQFSGAGSGVSSITFGSIGLTPSTATNGAITVAGTLAVANGGTNITSYAVGDLIYASTTGVLSKLADIATGNALISGGVNTAPSYGKIALTTHISGTLPVANGGTGDTTYTNGQLLIGNTTGNTLTKATLTAGSGITITNGTGTITIASSGGGTVTSVAMTVPTFLSVTGSPITSSGTLAVSLSGTALPVLNGGTGATNATDARTNLVAAKSGTNSDITELYALNGTSYGVAYQNATTQLIMGSALTFDGAVLYVPGGISGGTF